MELNYTLSLDDYLNFNLYYSSKNEQVNKQGRKAHIIFTISFAVFTLLSFYSSANYIITGALALATISILILYPKLFRQSLKNNYKKFVYHNYSETCPEQILVRFGLEDIEMINERASSKLKLKYMKSFIETGDYFFLRFSNVSFIIIPKRHYQDIDFIRKELMRQSQIYNIPLEAELDWKW